MISRANPQFWKCFRALPSWSREQIAAYNRECFEDLVSAGWDLGVIQATPELSPLLFIAVIAAEGAP